MKKLTILTSLSYVMRRLAFEDMLLDRGSPIGYIDWYAGIFKRRIEGIRDKYNHFGFGKSEVVSFYSPRFGMKDKQYECEKEIVKLVNNSNLYFFKF